MLNLKIHIGTGAVAYQVKPLPVALTSQMGTSVNPGCSTSNQFPDVVPGKAAEDNPILWASALM